MNHLRLHLLMVCLSLTAPLFGQPYTDHLGSVLGSPRDTIQLEYLSNFLLELINSGEIVPDTMFEQALELADELEDFWGQAIIYLNRSVYYLNTGEVKKGLVSVEEAIKYARKSDKLDLLAESYSVKMQLLMTGGETKASAELASALVKKYHDAGNVYYESEAYQLLSMLSSSFGDYELTMKYDSIAVALARQSEYIEILTTALYSSSTNLTFLGFPERALILAEEALVIAKEYKLEYQFGNILNARAEANTALENYTEALRDYEFLKELEGDQKFTWWMIGRGILLQRMNREAEARELLLDAIKLLKETSNDPLELKRCYQALQTVGLDQAQYRNVVRYGKLMEAVQDSLQVARNIKNLLELENKYKSEEQEAKILLQQEQLAVQRIRLYLAVSGLLFALVVGTVFYFLSRRLKKRNRENQILLRDKETLVGEIHHRVKNNLQVVSSLLRIQHRGLESDDKKGREALLESQNRLSAMGLIHNKLYQDKEMTSVRMPEYLEDLGETLLNAYRQEEQVEIMYDIEDLNLKVDSAIPLGLIINELVTNTLKYAFPEGRKGTIAIALHRKNGQLQLVVTDDGVGAAAAKKRADSTSFGNNLIGLLTKKLKGKLQVLDGKGYGVEILFEE